MKIQNPKINFVVALASLWGLQAVDTLVHSNQIHTWKLFSANMTEVLCRVFTEFRISNATFCVARAASNPQNTLACLKESRCVISSFAAPPSGQTQHNAGFTCWASHACQYGDRVLLEGEVIVVPDACKGTRNMTCSKQGMVYTDAPPRREACTEPFTAYSFGCMMFNISYTCNYCNCRTYCEGLGSQLASPATHEEVMAMTAYFTKQYTAKYMVLVGLRKLEDVWRWPSNLRDPGPKGTGDWHSSQPDPVDKAAMMYPHTSGTYSIGDAKLSDIYRPLCHVWYIKTGCL